MNFTFYDFPKFDANEYTILYCGGMSIIKFQSENTCNKQPKLLERSLNYY